MNNFMLAAYKEALKAYHKKEIPVGAVIVKNNKIISKAHNTRQFKYNVLGHAEINAIIKAEKKIKDWRLNDCELYVTLEPCELCEKIINEARLKNVYYLLPANKSKHKFKQTNDCEKLKSNYQEIVEKFFEEIRK